MSRNYSEGDSVYSDGVWREAMCAVIAIECGGKKCVQ